jgi:hypothetical protein
MHNCQPNDVEIRGRGTIVEAWCRRCDTQLGKVELPDLAEHFSFGFSLEPFAITYWRLPL